MTTTNTEIEGSLVNIVHVSESDEKTLLSLTTRDSLDFDSDEDSEDTSLSTERRGRRYRKHNAPIIEVESLLATDLDALEQIGLVDQDGELTTAPGSRRIDGAIHLEFYNDEGGDEAELIQRYEDVECSELNIDAGETPPVAGWTWHIHGGVRLNVPPDLLVLDGEEHIIESGDTETYRTTTVESGGTLTQESDSTLNTTG